MALIIGGHPRSGTTLLRRLFDRHPEIAVTGEFANFRSLGTSRARYARRIISRWWQIRGLKPTLLPLAVRGERPAWWRGHAFIARYVTGILTDGTPRVDPATIERTLLRLFPGTRVVGDKYPGYVFQLGQLDHPSLRRLVIYRDGRDVVSSALKNARTKWAERAFARNYDTAEKVAHRWVQAIEEMEKHADGIHIMRYEDLVRDPATAMGEVARWLDVDPSGFPVDIVETTSVGKHGSGLTPEEIENVMRIAGPTLERHGYV